jgi:hypothetical protein
MPHTSMVFISSPVQPYQFRRAWLTDVGGTLRSQVFTVASPPELLVSGDNPFVDHSFQKPRSVYPVVSSRDDSERSKGFFS